jgi:hypothetical protein
MIPGIANPSGSMNTGNVELADDRCCGLSSPVARGLFYFAPSQADSWRQSAEMGASEAQLPNYGPAGRYGAHRRSVIEKWSFADC